jgi:hypothetical protein
MKSVVRMGARALPVLLGVLMWGGAAQAATLEELAGTWSGSLNAHSGAQVPMIVHVMADGRAIVDSPAQGAFGTPAADVELEHNVFSFNVPHVEAHFHGVIEGGIMAIDGQWEERGYSLPLRLVRRALPQP